MRSLIGTQYFSQGAKPRKIIRVSDIDTGETILAYATRAFSAVDEYEDRPETLGVLTQSIKPEGGHASVSGITVDNLILDNRLTLCDEYDIEPKIDMSGSIPKRVAGRHQSIAMGDYNTARNAISAPFAEAGIVIGRNYSAGSGIHTVYRAPLAFSVPAGIITCDDAYIELSAWIYSTTYNFRIYGYAGMWDIISDAAFSAFSGWSASGNYTGTNLIESWSTSDWPTLEPFLVRLRFNTAGKNAILSASGSVFRMMLVSERDANYGAFGSGASGSEYVQFNSSADKVRLKIRANTKTLDNQRMELFYAFEDSEGNLPSVITSYTCDLIASQVIDSYKIDGGRLSLVGKSSDHRLNTMIPNKVITKADWPDCPEENIGKAYPIIYGTYSLTNEHLTGVGAFPSKNPSGSVTLNSSYPDAFSGIVVKSIKNEITALFSGHPLYLGSNQYIAFAWNNASNCFEIFPCRGTYNSDALGDYLVMIPAPYGNALPDAITAGFFRSASSIIPVDTPSYSISNPEKTYGKNISEYGVFDGLNKYVEYIFQQQPGGITQSGFGFIAYGDFISGDNSEMHLTMYEDVRTNPSDSPVWHLLDLDITPWADDGVIAGWIARYFYLDITKHKIRIEYKSSTGAPKLNRVCAIVPVEAKDIRTVYSTGYGKYSSGVLIENPARVIESIARSEMNHTESDINTTAFNTAYSELSGNKFAFQITEREYGVDIIDSLAYQSRLMTWRDHHDKLTAKFLNPSAPFPHSGKNEPGLLDRFTTDGMPDGFGSFRTHQIFSDVRISQVELDDCANDYVINYRKHAAVNEYTESIICNADKQTFIDSDLSGVTGEELKALCAESMTQLKTKKAISVDAWAIRDRATAAKFAQRLIQLKSKRLLICEFEAGMSALECDFGDFYNIRFPRISERFGEAEADRKKWMLIGKNINIDNDLITLKWIEVPTWLT